MANYLTISGLVHECSATSYLLLVDWSAVSFSNPVFIYPFFGKGKPLPHFISSLLSSSSICSKVRNGRNELTPPPPTGLHTPHHKNCSLNGTVNQIADLLPFSQRLCSTGTVSVWAKPSKTAAGMQRSRIGCLGSVFPSTNSSTVLPIIYFFTTVPGTCAPITWILMLDFCYRYPKNFLS